MPSPAPCVFGIEIPLGSVLIRLVSRHRVPTVSILKVSIRQVKAARALLGWSQGQLAQASGISEPTIKRLEAADGDIGGRADTSEAIRHAIEAAGVEFIAQNGGGAVCGYGRLRKEIG